MPSASSPVKDALEGYIAGRVKAERLVIAVSAAYYREAPNGKRQMLQPLIDVIDRASPGIVELGTVQGGSGFAISLAERPFPKEHEAELRWAAEAVLSRGGTVEGATGVGAQTADVGAQYAAPLPNAKASSGMIARLVAAVRRLFSPSA
jgi:hypothetical protein